MLHFKSCPKCSTGTVEHNNDAHGGYLQCLNCGFMRDVADDVTKKSAKAMLATWREEISAQNAEPATAVA
jgi:hypothetical protein